jgi:mRNA-degrading endonuclease RelE of RelBE toxin-antitoxin system
MRKYQFTNQFEKSFAKLPADIAELFEKKLPIFLENIFHPSFRTKKIEGFKDPSIWEASLTMNYRFTFEIDKEDKIIFRNIGIHTILERKKV